MFIEYHREYIHYKFNFKDPHAKYIIRLIPKVLIVLILLVLIMGCTRTEYVYVDTHALRSEVTTSLLVQCSTAEVGQVGKTNISLAKGYLKSTESLRVCQGISRELISYNTEYLNRKE